MKKREVLFGLREKLLLIFTFLFLGCLFGSFFAIHRTTSDYLSEQSRRILEEGQRSRRSTVVKNMEQYETMLSSLSSNQKIRDYIGVRYLSYPHEYEAWRDVIDPIVRQTLLAQRQGVSLQFIRPGEDSSEIIQSNFENILRLGRNINAIADGTQIYSVIRGSRLDTSGWFPTEDAALTPHWGQISRDRELGNISLYQRLSAESEAEIIRITVPLQSLFNTTEQDLDPLTYSDNFYLNGEKIYGVGETAPDQALAAYFAGTPADEQWFFLRAEPYSGVEMLTAHSAARVYARSRNLQLFTLEVLGGVSLACILLIWVISSSFTRRLRGIAQAMRLFENGSFVPIEDRHRDECSIVVASFNKMAGRINSLIEENLKVSIEKKEATLTLLQAQINPHMLYNSLSTIGRLAQRKDTENVIRLVRSMTAFYRLTLNRGDSHHPVREELRHLESYVEIYRIRMGEYFRFRCEADEQALDCYTINVILQPFVENIFEHALGLREEPVEILVTVRREGEAIRFCIADDGPGFDPRKPREERQGHSGYGIRNVDERIRLYFGPSYGTHIESAPGRGTRVAVTIPAITDWTAFEHGGDEYVSPVDC